MYKSNFTRLVAAINAEAGAAKQNDGSGSILKSIYDSNLKRSESAAVLKRAAKSMNSLNRQLTPTKAEKIESNRLGLRQFNKALSDAVRNRKLTAAEAARLEVESHHLSANLAAHGLI